MHFPLTAMHLIACTAQLKLRNLLKYEITVEKPLICILKILLNLLLSTTLFILKKLEIRLPIFPHK